MSALSMTTPTCMHGVAYVPRFLCAVCQGPPVRIVPKCPVCRIFPAPTRDPDWHLSTESHKRSLRDPSAGPERRVRVGERAERGSER